jgi:hypothetical protein
MAADKPQYCDMAKAAVIAGAHSPAMKQHRQMLGE